MFGERPRRDPDKVEVAQGGWAEEKEPCAVRGLPVGVGEPGDGLDAGGPCSQGARGEVLGGLIVVLEEGPGLDQITLGIELDLCIPEVALVPQADVPGGEGSGDLDAEHLAGGQGDGTLGCGCVGDLGEQGRGKGKEDGHGILRGETAPDCAGWLLFSAHE